MFLCLGSLNFSLSALKAPGFAVPASVSRSHDHISMAVAIRRECSVRQRHEKTFSVLSEPPRLSS